MTDSASVSFHDVHSSRSLFSSQQLSALSLRRHSRCKSVSSFVFINNKRAWRPPTSTLYSIIHYFPQGEPPLAFTVVNPAIRLFTERTTGLALAGYAVTPCTRGEVYVPASWEGGLVEDDVLRCPAPGHSGDDLEEEDDEENSLCLFSCQGGNELRRYTAASGHRYPYTGYRDRSGRNTLARLCRQRDQDMLDRHTTEDSDLATLSGDCAEATLPSVRTLATHCWRHCGQEDMLFSVFLTCTSTKALRMALLSVWWLSRYHGISLRIVNMRSNEQLAAFSMLRQLLTVTELHCVRCTLSAEWMQSISSCTDITSLSIASCIAGGNGVKLMYIDSILSSSVVEGRRGHSKWYLSGTLSVGLLKKLKCLHIFHTPVQQDFIELLASCTSLECVLLHRCRGVESLQPLTKLPRLRCVSLQNCSIKDQGVQYLGQCTMLQHLYLIECRRLTSLKFLSDISASLQLLNLSQNYFSDEHMQQIGSCTQLVELHLKSLKRLTNVNHLQFLRQLEVLSLSDNALTSSGCAALLNMQLCRVDLSRCTNLTSINGWTSLVSQLVSLDLSGSGVESEGLSSLSACEVLRYLNLSECIRLNSIAFVKPLSALRWLSLAGTSLSDAEAQHLSDLTILRYLSLKECKHLHELDFVEHLTLLEYLDLENTSLLNLCMLSLARCAALRFLNLSRCHSLTDVTLLGGLPALKELNLSYTSLTDAGMSRLCECTSLEVLHLRGCRQLRTLTGLRGLSFLKELNLDYYSMAAESSVSFVLPLQQLSSHSGLGSSRITWSSQLTSKAEPYADMLSSSTIGALSRTSSTSGTDISSPNSVLLSSDTPGLTPFVPMLFPNASETPPSLSLPDLRSVSIRRGVLNDLHLIQLLASCAWLTQLDLSDCHHLTHLTALRGLPRLRQLTVSNTRITNAAVEGIGACTGLEGLSVAGCEALTDLTPLSGLRRLRVLDASCTHLTNAGLASLASCRGLVYLSLTRCAAVTDVGPLAALELLQELHLESTGVTAEGIARLARCAALRRLYLTRCRRLTSVDALKQLEVLEVYGTSVPHRIAGRPQPAGCTIA